MQKDTILVIQENKKSAYFLDFLLSREGYEVIATTGCYETETLIGKIHPPKLIILDLGLSRANNNKLIALIKKQTDWVNTPVLLLVNRAHQRSVSSALDAGANDYILQPFSHTELLTEIHRHSDSVH
ncbi:MAG: response regulator [Gammaproteobacteria bacterium]